MEALEAEHRGWHRFGEALSAGLFRYVLLTARRVEGNANLEAANLARIEHAAPYSRARIVAPAAARSAPVATNDLERELAALASSIFEIPLPRLDAEMSFADMGVGSLQALRFLDAVNRRLGLTPGDGSDFDYPTLHAFGQHVRTVMPRQAATHVRRRRHEPDVDEGDAIAVIGMACRLPGANDPFRYWDNLVHGRCSITEVPPERWATAEHYDPDGANGSRSKWGGFIEDAGCFDPQFFHLSPREAEVIDPQQRVFLKTAWSALEDAGYADRRKRVRCGVIAGMTGNEYQTLLHREEVADRLGGVLLSTRGDSGRAHRLLPRPRRTGVDDRYGLFIVARSRPRGLPRAS